MRGSSQVECTEIFQKFCDGDDVAVRWVLDRFGPLMLKLIERRLGGRAVRRRIDPDDVLQSALLNFYRWRNRRERRVESLRDFAGMLISLCLHAAGAAMRHHGAARRDVKRACSLPAEIAEDRRSARRRRAAALQDVKPCVLDCLSGEIRWACAQRLAGQRWCELAVHLGTTADALRKRVQRAIVREIKCSGTSEP